MSYVQVVLTGFRGPETLEVFFAMLAEGHIDPAVAEVVPLSEVRRAHERVEAGEVQGKLVMRVSER